MILTTRFSSVSDSVRSSSRYGFTNCGLRLPRTRNISGASIRTLSSGSCSSAANTGMYVSYGSGVFVAMFSDAQMKLSLTFAASSEANRNSLSQYGSMAGKLPRPILPSALRARSRKSGSALSQKDAMAGTCASVDAGYASPISPSSQSAFARIFTEAESRSDET